MDAAIGNIKSLIVGAGNNYSELTLPNFDSVVGNYPDRFDVAGEVSWWDPDEIWKSWPAEKR